MDKNKNYEYLAKKNWKKGKRRVPLQQQAPQISYAPSIKDLRAPGKFEPAWKRKWRKKQLLKEEKKFPYKKKPVRRIITCEPLYVLSSKEQKRQRAEFLRPLYFVRAKKSFYNKFFFRNSVFFLASDWTKMATISLEPVAVNLLSLELYTERFYGLLTNNSRLFSQGFGRRSMIYYPKLIWYYKQSHGGAPLEKAVRPRKKYLRRRKFISRPSGYLKMYSFLDENRKLVTRKLRFWASEEPIYLKKSFVKKIVNRRGYSGVLRFATGDGIVEQPAQTGIYHNLCSLSRKKQLAARLVKKFLVSFLACYVKKKLFFGATGWMERPWMYYEAKLRRLNTFVLLLYKKEFVFLVSLNNSFRALERDMQKVKKIRSELAALDFYKFFELSSLYKQFLEQLPFHFLFKGDYSFVSKLKKRGEGTGIMAYKFLRRVSFLLTKRGGRLRAFKFLVLLRNLTSVEMLPGSFMRHAEKARNTKDIFVRIMKNLKTYFFLRKFTKGRKTTLIPGILYKRKKIKVIARWFLASLRKKKLGRPLLEKLLENTRNVYYGQGASQELQMRFNLQVRDSKINIIPKRGARVFRPPYQKKPRGGAVHQRSNNSRGEKKKFKLAFKRTPG